MQNVSDLLARVRQRKKELRSWQWWDTKVGRKVYHLRPQSSPIVEPALTPAERKRQHKLERQTAQEDRRKRIKLGLEQSGPKLKVKNAPFVFPGFASDPTKYENIAREAQNKRHEEHLKRNEERKLSGDERWVKQLEKATKNRANLRCIALVTPALSGKEQYIVDYTAKKFALTGALLLGENDAYVIVEGGDGEIAKCEKLLCEKLVKGKLLWKGSLPAANFGRWSVHSLPDRKEFLKVYGVDSIFQLQ